MNTIDAGEQLMEDIEKQKLLMANRGSNPSEKDIRENIPYVVWVADSNNKVCFGFVKGRLLKYPVVEIIGGEKVEVSIACLIHQWETGKPIKI